MRIHYLQHEPTEGPGYIEEWAQAKGYALTSTQLWRDEVLPEAQNFDCLLVFGGPMNIYEHDLYPWLIPEKKFIAEAIAAQKKVIGFCLGSQLIADILGGPVTRNHCQEIGWFPIEWREEALKLPVFNGLPKQQMVFHWHGDTFALPPGSIPLAESAGCTNQGFAFGKNVLAFQFHVEFTQFQVQQFLENNVLPPGEFIQKPEAMLAHPEYFKGAESLLITFLNRFLG